MKNRHRRKFDSTAGKNGGNGKNIFTLKELDEQQYGPRTTLSAAEEILSRLATPAAREKFSGLNSSLKPQWRIAVQGPSPRMEQKETTYTVHSDITIGLLPLPVQPVKSLDDAVLKFNEALTEKAASPGAIICVGDMPEKRLYVRDREKGYAPLG
jgi:hypothetical protein